MSQTIQRSNETKKYLKVVDKFKTTLVIFRSCQNDNGQQIRPFENETKVNNKLVRAVRPRARTKRNKVKVISLS